MQHKIRFIGWLLFTSFFICCAKSRPFLSNHIKQAYDAVLVNCDPHDLGKTETCLIFSAAFQKSLYAFDASKNEMLLGPNPFLPLKVRVGPVTDDLVPVMSREERFPFMLAIDRAQSAYYPIQLFKNDQSESFFGEPKAQKLIKAPFKSAAVDIDGQVLLVSTYPEENKIRVFTLNRKNGVLENALTSVNIDIPDGGIPCHIAVNDNLAVISDEKLTRIYSIKISDIASALKNKKSPLLTTIEVGMPNNRLVMSARDFGQGLKTYAVLLHARGKAAKLVNIDAKKVEASIEFASYPSAAYFPDNFSDACCHNVKNWFSVSTLDGKLNYVAINSSTGASLSLSHKTVVDLTSETNLSLSQVQVIKILGGAIKRDSNQDYDYLCPKNRETYFITGSAHSRGDLDLDRVPEEGHAYMCEGGDAALKFGYKAK